MFWFEAKEAISESGHPSYNSICYHTKDVRNWSDTKIADELLISTIETSLIVKAFIPLVFTVGFVGNVAFFLLLIRVKTMKTILNFYLANLAVADLITLSLVTMTRSWMYVDFKQVQSWPFHTSFGCAFYYFAIHWSSVTSILLITIISFDRYFAICHPIKYRITKRKNKASILLALLAWIISTELSLLRSLASGRLVHECILWPSHEKYKYFQETIKQCMPIHPLFRRDILEHVVHSIPFIAAVIANSFVNIKIVQRLTRPCPGENENQQNQQLKQRITWMLLVNSIVFFISLAPKNVLLMFGTLMNLSDHKLMYYERTAFIFFMLNSAINPILYGAVSPSYRRGFLKVFGLARN